MRILLLSPWLPWPPHDGGRIRVLETLRFLAARHQVTLLTHVSSQAERQHVDALRGLCESVEVRFVGADRLHRIGRVALGLLQGYPVIQSIYYSRERADLLRKLSADDRFDIIQIEFSMIARYARAISSRCTAKRVLSTHNIESQRFEREIPLSRWGLRRLALMINGWMFPAWEQRSLQQFDGAVAVSEHDRDWLRRHLPGGMVGFVPNGVDCSYFQPNPTDGVGASLVFTGVMDYPPNVDAVLWFVGEVFPRLRARFPELRFDIVGARPSPQVLALQDRAGVTVTGEVPDVRPFVRKAAAFVVPLRSGGGTRLKILQAMALGCPVISTRIGAEGLDVAHDQTLLFADEGTEFLKQLERLLESHDLRQRIVHQGRDLVTRRYEWQSCLLGLEDLYRQLSERAET